MTKLIDNDQVKHSTIADRVKFKRLAKGWKANVLAAKCDVPATSINMLEMGKVKIPQYLIKLADVLGTTTDFLLRGDSDYYLVKIKKGETPFYSSGMTQVAEVVTLLIDHKL